MNNARIQKLPSIRRLPSYLHRLNEMRFEGCDKVSTTLLAGHMNIEPIVVRKDLEITGVTGQPGVGYQVDELIAAIKKFLGWDNTSEALLAGAGSLGSALLGYQGFEDYGLKIIAAFDTAADKIGTRIHGCEVFELARLPELSRKFHVCMGILCVPPASAQAVADLMIEGGIRAIWNFTSVSLQVPEGIVVQREVIASGLAVMSIKLQYELNGWK
ncbi:MAG: redox-sensing transcriptional repressor Rex [Victivallaceae bacterium]